MNDEHRQPRPIAHFIVYPTEGHPARRLGLVVRNGPCRRISDWERCSRPMDNTIKYSDAFRVKQRDQYLLSSANQDDGDQNFARGMISNRLDLLSEFDVSFSRLWPERERRGLVRQRLQSLE